MSRRILIVEDDASIRFGLEELLGASGFETVSCERGDSVVEDTLKMKPADLIILDVMLPGRNGYAACKDLRTAGCRVPILMLTAKSQERDKVLGLDAGADDYVTKPFSNLEMVARVNALLRRAEHHSKNSQLADPFVLGECQIDPKNFTAVRAGVTETLMPKEMALLVCLHRKRSEVLTRDHLLNEVWGVNYYGTTRTLDQTVAQVRKKIGDSGEKPRHLLTVHGIGYRLAE